MSGRDVTLRWGDPEERQVLEDSCLERGVRMPPLPPYVGYGYGYGDGDGDYDYGDGGGYGDYGDGGDGGGGSYGGDGGGGSYGGDGGGGSYGGDGETWRHGDMRHGLHIICSPGGYGPYVRIGWCRRVDGDEWELVGARVIRRFGRDQQLAALAVKGPAADTQLLDASREPEAIHRLHAIRSIVADEAAWAKDCPRPEGWS